MSLTLINNSRAVVTQLGANPDGTSCFTITSGSLPLSSGQTLTADNTTITNNIFSYFGSPEGRIYMFLDKGDAQIDLYINNNIVTSTDSSSGWATINCPILSPSDAFEIRLIGASSPVPSQTPTPSQTAPVTPTPTGTPSPTPTPSSTPPIVRGLIGVSFYPQDDTTVLSACTGDFYGNDILLTQYKLSLGAPFNPFFSGTGFSDFSTGGTANITLSASPQAGFYLTDYPATSRPSYDEQRLTGFTYAGVFGGKPRWTGTTGMYSGGTLVDTEPNAYIQRNTNGQYELGATGIPYPDTGYFYGMPTP